MPAALLIARYARIFRKHLPTGPIWDNPNGIFRSLAEAMGVEPARIQESVDALAAEVVDPGKATLAGLLTDYERFALLPDEKPVGGETESQRQQVVAAKLNTTYPGPTKKFFKDLAIKFGFVDGSGNSTITIQDCDDLPAADVAFVDEALVDDAMVSEENDAFTWQITFPTGTTNPGTANSQVEKFKIMVGRLKPAHTEVIYAVAA
jgi:uncharacterized protein YmfQ (DUF2313 family)